MTIRVKVEGADRVVASLRGHGQRVRRATAVALNRTARAVRFDILEDIKAGVAGGATPYTLRAFGLDTATQDNLTARWFLKNDAPAKGSNWQRTLSHLFEGGPRDIKRVERAFEKAGILPAGRFMVPAADSWAMPLDANGNVPRGLIVQIISYFNAFGEQGYRANMSDRRRANLAKQGRTASGHLAINGVMYFVSQGKGRGQHLAAGIWAKRGTHGADVAPVFLFVRQPAYGRRFNPHAIASRTVDRLFQRNFDAALEAEMRSVR